MKAKGPIIAISAVLILILVFVLFSSGDDSSTDNDSDKLTPTVTSSDTLSPEDVLENLDGDSNQPSGPLSIEIVGPEGETFQKSQARHYEAKVTNLGNFKGMCYWWFCLNAYDTEELYQEQTTQVTGGEKCGFTSTFINERGELRVVVRVEKTKYYDGNNEGVLEEATATRNYTVL
jgi:hypothetical protein